MDETRKANETITEGDTYNLAEMTDEELKSVCGGCEDLDHTDYADIAGFSCRQCGCTEFTKQIVHYETTGSYAGGNTGYSDDLTFWKCTRCGIVKSFKKLRDGSYHTASGEF